MHGFKVTHPGHTYILHSSTPSVPFRAKFVFTLVSLLILGVDIALAYAIYRLTLLIF